MANTLTNLIPQFYANLDVVSRELVGMIPSVMRDPKVDRAAVGQTVYSFVAPVAAATDITPGVTPPNDGDQTIGNVPITITKSRRVPFRWNGEETLGVNNGGPGSQAIQANQIAQAIRTLTNEMEQDLCNLFVKASRAFGSPGTTPYGTNLSESAQVRKILADNGAPMSALKQVIDTTAGANMRTLANLTRVSESGDTTLLRQGVLLDLHGFAIRESAKIATPAKGTGASYTSTAAGFAVGTTVIPLITGTGTVLAGDVVTFAGDTNKYVVSVGVAAPGSITLAQPGLRQAIPAVATALTVQNASTRSMCFAETAILLAARAPALPDGGDMAVDRVVVVDPRTGFPFELALYPQYRQMQYELSAAWGVASLKDEHIALMLG